MEMTDWGTVIQTLIVAICTWYLRRGGKKDTAVATATVVKSTASQVTSDEILKRVAKLETDVSHLREIYVTQFGIDHRGPTRTN